MRLWPRKPGDEEVARELCSHLEAEAAEQLENRVSAEEAGYVARRVFGNVTLIAEEVREVWGWTSIDRIRQDFGYAVRTLKRGPGFTCTVTFVLALGISAAVSIFGLVEAALIKPLPYRDQTHLVSAFESSRRDARLSLPYLDFVDWKRLNTVFSSIDAYALNGGFTLSTDTGAEPVTGTRVSAPGSSAHSALLQCWVAFFARTSPLRRLKRC
jgi:macrolide transport system ATP-binding/permease protein